MTVTVEIKTPGGMAGGFDDEKACFLRLLIGLLSPG
jgi:hypothetical protein